MELLLESRSVLSQVLNEDVGYLGEEADWLWRVRARLLSVALRLVVVEDEGKNTDDHRGMEALLDTGSRVYLHQVLCSQLVACLKGIDGFAH